MKISRPRTWIVSALLAIAATAHADEIQVAVTPNFAAPVQAIAIAFEKDTGHTIKLSFGSSSRFYSQIAAGAPFDVLLANDDATPDKLIADGKGLADTRHTYAIGRLVLWSPDANMIDAQGDVLKSSKFKHLAIADAKLARFGQAAQETLARLGDTEIVQPRLLTAENLGQAYQFVATGGAELGFVALGQVLPPGVAKVPGSIWIVPENLYTPLRQDEIVISTTKVRAAATAFVNYLVGDKAHAVIKAYGYRW